MYISKRACTDLHTYTLATFYDELLLLDSVVNEVSI